MATGVKSQLFGRLRQEDYKSEAREQVQGQPDQLTETQSQSRGKKKVSTAAYESSLAIAKDGLDLLV